VERFGEANAEAILAGEIRVGMTRDAVLAARGAPSRREQVGSGEELWTYGAERVVILNGRVSYIGR
jgi:hypothetical protein